MSLEAELQEKVYAGVLEELKTEVETFTDDEKALLKRCAFRAGRVTILALTNPAAAKAEKADVDAQLANLKVAAQATAVETVWRVVAKILEVAVPILLKSVL